LLYEIGFIDYRSLFHISRLFYSKFSIGMLSSYKVWMQEEEGSGVSEM